MAVPKPKSPAHGTPSDTSRAVDAFMGTLEHPCKVGIESMRRLMLGVDPGIREGIKWNAPSFRTTEYFATTNLRSKGGIGVILHLGARVRRRPAGGVKIDDPKELLKWLGKDRAMVEFSSSADLEKKAAAFRAVLRQWIRYV
jgi:Domain of unknown function (DU1801)